MTNKNCIHFIKQCNFMCKWYLFVITINEWSQVGIWYVLFSPENCFLLQVHIYIQTEWDIKLKKTCFLCVKDRLEKISTEFYIQNCIGLIWKKT